MVRFTGRSFRQIDDRMTGQLGSVVGTIHKMSWTLITSVCDVRVCELHCAYPTCPPLSLYWNKIFPSLRPSPS